MAREPDPRGELTQLERALAEGLPPGVVLRGAERWFRQRSRDLLTDAARAAGMELCRHDVKGGDFELARLLDDLVGSALFAPSRCVVIEEPGDLLKKDSSLTRGIRSFLDGERGTVVLSARTIRADAAAVKLVKAAGGLMLSFRKLYDSPPPWGHDKDPRSTELVAFVVERSRQLGAPLTPDRAVLLSKRTGNELEALESALQSLRGGEASDLLPAGDEAAGSPFEAADALVAGRPGTAIARIEALYRGGMRKDKDGTRERGAEALFAILMGTLRGRLRDGLAISLAMERGAGFKQAADEAGVSAAPFVRGKLEDLCRGRNAADWRRMLDDAVGLERRSREGKRVDGSDLARLALRWRKKGRAPMGAGAAGR